nr:hypothetical protein Iba_chr04dCG15080 [Ipomoea batatas]
MDADLSLGSKCNKGLLQSGRKHSLTECSWEKEGGGPPSSALLLCLPWASFVVVTPYSDWFPHNKPRLVHGTPGQSVYLTSTIGTRGDGLRSRQWEQTATRVDEDDELCTTSTIGGADELCIPSNTAKPIGKEYRKANPQP